jgi:hypothetical protein
MIQRLSFRRPAESQILSKQYNDDINPAADEEFITF